MIGYILAFVLLLLVAVCLVSDRVRSFVLSLAVTAFIVAMLAVYVKLAGDIINGWLP